MALENIVKKLRDPAYVRPFRPLPFWSWNDKLDKNRLIEQMEWMNECGIGGFFMHARSGLITEYLGREWMECCDACCDKAAELDMDAYMYDENGWPSGFAGGKLLEDEKNRDKYLTYKIGEYDDGAFVSYVTSGKALVRTEKAQKGVKYLNVYCHTAVSTVDILNPEVVEKFLDLTHRAYKARYKDKFSEKLKGFFTDEPQYFRWDTSYTPMIAKYFTEKYGEDILDGLGLLFVEKEGYEEFRFKYWSGMRALMLENFAKKLYGFCEENNMYLTGHYVEETTLGNQMSSCGGTMPFYEYEHIPGIDWLGRGLPSELPVKQVGSVAAQTGKNRVLTETFGCCGWDVTPRELKKILDYQYIGGINVMCHHLLPSSEYGQRKRDYPQHYTPLNPWTKRHFGEFNNTYTRLGALIGNSTEVVDVCVLHPVTSAYINYKRNADYYGIREYDEGFISEVEMLASLHIPHHYVDEILLEKMGGTEGGKLVCGKCSYKYFILPSVINLNESTLALINKFVECGGKLLMLGTAPTLLSGKKHKFDIKSNCTLDEIKAAMPYSIDNGRLRSSLRTAHGETFVFVINPTDEPQSYNLKIGGAKSVRELDTQTLKVSDPLPLNGTLRPGQSALLFPQSDTPVVKPAKPVVKLGGNMKVVSSTPNILMIDKVRYALEGGEFGESVTLIQLFAELLEKRYSGKLKLEYEFNTEYVPSELKLYAEDMNTEKVEINGTGLISEGTLEHEPMVHIYNAAPYVKTGVNKIVITLNYFQDESVYYALFGEGVTESLRNCMVYNTSLESVYIAGDFGVYPVNLRKGQTERTVICDGFVIKPAKTQINSFMQDGYSVFAGNITLEGEITCGSEGAVLELDGRWQTAEIEINGKQTTLLFDNAADISDMVHEGKNTVRVTVTTSLRNVMGPHHFAPIDDPEPLGPEAFTLAGSWKNGKNPYLREAYALVDTFRTTR